jgi:hypothetical protein
LRSVIDFRSPPVPSPLARHPEPSEFDPYFDRYISLVPDGDVVAHLVTQAGETVTLLSKLSEPDGGYRYAPGKWSVKEVVGHVIDTERVFAYRVMRFARNDPTPLAGFEQDPYVANGGFDGRALADLVAEFSSVRAATVHLLNGLDDEASLRRGMASNHAITVRALAYLIAGHERHHVNILRERYLPALGDGA